MALALCAVVFLSFLVLDGATTVTYMQAEREYKDKDISVLSSLVQRAYVGMPKAEFLALLKQAAPGELVKEEGSLVVISEQTFEFDAGGKFVRVVASQ